MPLDVGALVGKEMYVTEAGFPVEQGYVWSLCAATENGNPLFWDDQVASEITKGAIAPPSMLSTWLRPHHWTPEVATDILPLQLHFDLKEQLGLPEAVISENTLVLHTPVRLGDVPITRQRLRSISSEKRTKLGTGRFWVIDVEYETSDHELLGIDSYTAFGYCRDPEAKQPEASNEVDIYLESGPTIENLKVVSDAEAGSRLPDLEKYVTTTTVVLGAMATRDWRPMHHDRDFAVNRNGTQDIFMNTPTFAGWFERYITDWAGPLARLGRMSFNMRDSVFPGDDMIMSGIVTNVWKDDTDCSWIDLNLTITQAGRLCVTAAAKVAVPTVTNDNPWLRNGDAWRP